LEEYSFLVNGKGYKIRLLKHERDAQFLMEVNNKTSQLELQEEFSYSLPFTLKIAGKSHRVGFNNIKSNNQFFIKIDGKTHTVQHEVTGTLLPPAFKPSVITLGKKANKKPVSEKGAVTAPMPGKIVLIRVKVGDTVQVSDALCVLEAMKMENEITAPKTGRVKEVLVAEGANVNSGDALIIIEE